MAARLYSEVPARNADRLAFQPVLLAKIKRLVSKARAFTGEQEQTGIPLLNPEDEEDQPRSPELIAKINELELNALRLQQQMNLRKQRLSDLNCANLPVASTAPGGALALTKTVLIRDHGNGDCTYTCLDYRYGEDWASFLIVGDAPDRRKITWNWAGMPGSLDSGQEFTITITGTLDFKPAGAEKGANVAAGLRQIGLISLKEQNAYFYQGASSPGSYTYKVPAGAKRVEFALSADNNIGTFIRYCYGDCPQ